MVERWKDIKGYKGLYQVSNKGRVKSLKRHEIQKNGRVRVRHERILALIKSSEGYLMVNLYAKGKRTTRLVHRLVAQAFIPNPLKKPFIDHINRDTTDNRVENLRWCNQSENILNPNTVAYRSMMIGAKKAVDVAASNGIPKETFYRRIRQGWSLSEASVRPPKKYTSKKRKLNMKLKRIRVALKGRVGPSV